MLSHAMVGTHDMQRATAFYDGVLGTLGAKQVMKFPSATFWGETRPEFGVCTPYDGKPASVGNGTMVALLAPTRALVDETHANALAAGGTDEGAPGLRGDESNGFYAAYFRDLDGNKLCIYRVGPA
jgi:catechol 2,3-dioxygenase-like lactoylglutathione lyase family enzyme